MTCAELVDDVEAEIRYAFIAAQQEVPGTEEIIRIANKYNDRISKDLRIPRRYAKDIDATTPFAMPAEARPGSATFVEEEEEEDAIRVLTISEANVYYPDWERNEHEGHSRYPHKLVIYDPHNVSSPVYPIGFSAGDKLRMLYVIKVKPMVLENSAGDANVGLEPFDGLMPEYHHIIAQMTKFELLLRLGDDRGRAYYNDAQAEIVKAFGYARNKYVLPVVPNLGSY